MNERPSVIMQQTLRKAGFNNFAQSLNATCDALSICKTIEWSISLFKLFALMHICVSLLIHAVSNQQRQRLSVTW